MKKVTVGFDVSKGYGDADFRNEAGSCLTQSGRYDGTAAGHKLLADEFEHLAKQYSEVEFVVGLEASGGLERNWEKFFKGLKASYNLEVLILNPFAVKKHLERNLRRNRTDKISAANIAEYLSTARRKQDVESESELAGARALYRCITAAIGRRVQAQCQLQSLLPQVHPELVQYCRDGVPEWVLEVLLHYPTPPLLAKAKAKTLSKIDQITLKKATGLIEAARSSVASMTDDAAAASIVFLCKQIKHQNKEIATLQKTLIDSLKDDPDVKIIDSIKGFGLWTAVVLRLEYGTMERFHSAGAAVAFAGLDPRIDQSGDVLRNLGISRAGHSRIRAALYMPTLAAINFNPVVSEFYKRLVGAGKPEKVAQVACMRKLIHILYACLVTERCFDPDYENNHRKQEPQTKRKAPAVSPKKQQTDLTAPVSRKEAKKRKAAAAMPQKDQSPFNARSDAAADNSILTAKTT